jgi:hypothetical protein
MSVTWNNGDRALGWRSGEALWYPGTVKGADGDRFVVRFDDGSSAQLPADHLRPAEIEPGMRLQANWEGMGTWYSGVVERKDGDKCEIKYADGDEETVEVGRVRLSGNVPPSVRSCLVLTNAEAEEGEVSLVRLTPEWLTLAPVPKEALATTARDLADGGTVSGQIISLASLVKLEGGEDEADLSITFREDGETTTATVQFASPGAREGFLGALLEKAGPGWNRRERKVRRWLAALWMLIITAAVLCATWFLHYEASQLAAGRKPLLPERGSGRLRLIAVTTHWVESVIGPTGVLIVGGIALAVCAFLWLSALAYPPAHVVWEREGLT